MWKLAQAQRRQGEKSKLHRSFHQTEMETENFKMEPSNLILDSRRATRSRNDGSLKATNGATRSGTVVPKFLSCGRAGGSILCLSAAAVVFSFSSLAFGQVATTAEEAIDARLATWKSEIERKEQAIGKRFVTPPQGKFYEETVPDTLDLADRAALAINCLTGALDPDYACCLTGK